MSKRPSTYLRPHTSKMEWERPPTPEAPHPRPAISKYIDPHSETYYRLSSQVVLLPSQDLNERGQQKKQAIYTFAATHTPKDIVRHAKLISVDSGSFYPNLSSSHFKSSDRMSDKEKQNLRLCGVSTKNPGRTVQSSLVVAWAQLSSTEGWVYTIHNSLYYFSLNT